MDLGLSRLVADLMGLPEWTPKALAKAGGVALLLCMYFMPATFKAGFELWVREETQHVMAQFAPILHQMVPPKPAPHHRP
ncbi:MAG: hypothetical protein NVSMB48_13060 [Marmoricola sp.]